MQTNNVYSGNYTSSIMAEKKHESFFWYAGRLISFIYCNPIRKMFVKTKGRIYTGWVSSQFKQVGTRTAIGANLTLIGGKYITLGKKTHIGPRGILTAFDKYGSQRFTPSITIGDYVSIGEDCHITAINKIEIADHVLFGKKVTITDNSHGESTSAMLNIPPIDRPLYTAGPVIIEENVWVGDKVTILPNVRIGKNSIVGSNAVVTKDIPANCIVGGIPAKVIREIK